MCLDDRVRMSLQKWRLRNGNMVLHAARAKKCQEIHRRKAFGKTITVIFINYPCSTMSGVEWTVAACKNGIAATPMGEKNRVQFDSKAWSISGTVFLFSHQCHFFYMLSSSLIVCFHFCIFIGKISPDFSPWKNHTPSTPLPPRYHHRRFQASVDQLKALQLRCPFHLPAPAEEEAAGSPARVMLSPMKTYRCECYSVFSFD